MKSSRCKTLLEMAARTSSTGAQENEPIHQPDNGNRSPSPCPFIEGTPEQIQELIECMNTPRSCINEEESDGAEIIGMDKYAPQEQQLLFTGIKRCNIITDLNEDVIFDSQSALSPQPYMSSVASKSNVPNVPDSEPVPAPPVSSMVLNCNVLNEELVPDSVQIPTSSVSSVVSICNVPNEEFVPDSVQIPTPSVSSVVLNCNVLNEELVPDSVQIPTPSVSSVVSICNVPNEELVPVSVQTPTPSVSSMMSKYNVPNEELVPDPVSIPTPSVSSVVSNMSTGGGGTTPSNRKRKYNIRKQTQKKHLDFVSDNEDSFLDFEWNSTDWKGTSNSESDTDDANSESRKKKKKKRLKTKNKKVTTSEDVIREDEIVGNKATRMKNINKRQKRKILRQSGQAFQNEDGSTKNAKAVKANPCIGKKCQHNCGEITEEKRNRIFNHYWNLSPQRRRDWLVSMSQKMEVKRKRVKDSSRRVHSFSYFINEGEGRRQVCQQFILATLDITQAYVYYTLSNSTHGSSKEDMRGKVTPSNKTKEEVLISVRQFIKSLPAVPSHYCRKDSTKLYLPQELKNLTYVYNIYRKEQTQKGLDVVGEKVFRTVFTIEFNIGFHMPKKDKCVKCTAAANDGIGGDVLKEHNKEKEASNERFKAHKKIHLQNSKCLCASFDLQKILQTPHGESMLLYYSRKYTQFNLTFYECGTRNGMCYTWGENDGKRGANEVSTILSKYIKKVDDRGNIAHLLLYCDSCAGQNKNKTVLATIHSCLMNCSNIETIQINYLLPGHTHMPVDSMHAVIENSIKNMIVWAPSQWPTIFELARKNPAPYTVTTLRHKDFAGYDTVADKYFRGNLIGKISKLRVATFKKHAPNKMYVKYSMDSTAKTEEIDIMRSKLMPNEIYKTPLGISKPKHGDLLRLCSTNVIPQQYQSEYKNMAVVGSIKDTLYDSDIEDEDVEFLM